MNEYERRPAGGQRTTAGATSPSEPGVQPEVVLTSSARARALAPRLRVSSYVAGGRSASSTPAHTGRAAPTGDEGSNDPLVLGGARSDGAPGVDDGNGAGPVARVDEIAAWQAG